jgi:MFS family permease
MLHGFRGRGAGGTAAAGGVIARAAALHPGWMVLGAGTIGVFMTTPGQTVGVSAAIDHIAADLRLPRGEVMVLYSIGTLLGILPAPLIGRLVDRYGPRRSIGVIVLAVGAACALLSAVQGPWSLAAGFTLLRGSAIGGLSLVSTLMVTFWFDRFRGRAIAVAMMGLAGGGLVVPPLAESITVAFDWRTAYLALGAGVVVLMLPVGLFCFRDRPQRCGMVPDFGRTPVRPAGAQGADDLTLGAAMRTRIFWYLLLIGILANAVGTALLLDHLRALQADGLTRVGAVGLLGTVTVVQALAMLAGGALIDRFGARRAGLLGIAMLFLTIGLLLTGPGLLAGFAYATAFGAMLGVMYVVPSTGLAEYFGTRHLGSIRGVTSMVGVMGAAAGPLPLVWSVDGAYWIYLTSAGAALGLGILSPRRREIRV